MNDWCKEAENISPSEKYKDIIEVYEGFYYTVYVSYCKVCGALVKEGTWVE